MESCATIAIAVVDREPGFRTGLAGMLREDGHDVADCGDASELVRLELPRVDVLVCAHDMPGQDGVWLVDRFRRSQPRVAVVLLTAYGTLAPADAVAARPFLRVVEKPVAYDELHAIVHDVAADAAA